MTTEMESSLTLSPLTCYTCSDKNNYQLAHYPTQSSGILWVKSGYMLLNADEEYKQIFPGQWCFFTSTAQLDQLNQGSELEFEGQLFFIDSKFLESFVSNQEKNRPESVDTTSKNHLLSLPIGDTNAFEEQMLQLLQRSTENRECTALTQSHLLNALLSQICTRAPSLELFIRQAIDSTVTEKCLEFIEHKLDQEINLPMLAEHLGISVSTVKRRLSTDGFTFINLVQSKRVYKSAVLLRSGRTSIADIARQCGFKSAAHFSTAFKGHYGCTPKMFRRERRTP